MQAGVVNAPIERSAAKPTPGVTPVHDLNVPYEGTEEYETPTADLLFPPVSFFYCGFSVFAIRNNPLVCHMVDVVGAFWNVRPLDKLQCRTHLCPRKLQCKFKLRELRRLIIFLLELVMNLVVATQQTRNLEDLAHTW